MASTELVLWQSNCDLSAGDLGDMPRPVCKRTGMGGSLVKWLKAATEAAS